MGKDIKPKTPKMVIRIEITVDKTGLSIKVLSILDYFLVAD